MNSLKWKNIFEENNRKKDEKEKKSLKWSVLSLTQRIIFSNQLQAWTVIL